MNNAHGDILPPARVTDLVLLKRSRANNTVTVSWTAPGADLDQGTGEEAEAAQGQQYRHRQLDSAGRRPRPGHR